MRVTVGYHLEPGLCFAAHTTPVRNSNAISMSDYKMESMVYELNLAGARLAREAADEFMAAEPSRPRFVAGAVGPTNRTASMSPDVNNPAFRASLTLLSL